MTPTCLTGLILTARIEDFQIPEILVRWLDSPSFVVSAAILTAGLLGLLFGWILGKSGRSPEGSGQDYLPAADTSAFSWRHEKLVLVERQEAEKQDRIVRLVEDVSIASDQTSAEIRARLFRISETLRDIRQRVGTDLSRLEILVEKLSGYEAEDLHRSAVEGSIEIAESHISRLREVRDLLRNVTPEILALEDSFPTGLALSEPERKNLQAGLDRAQTRLAEIPTDWRLLTDEADRTIRELLAGVDTPFLETLRDVLLVDGAVTGSLALRSDNSIREDIEAVCELLSTEESGIISGNPFEKTFPVERSGSTLIPDSSFRNPEPRESSNGNGSHTESSPAKPEECSEEAPDGPLILFRSNRIELWGTDVYRGANERARSIRKIPEWANWISIRRTDTGESVFAPAANLSLSQSELESGFGFNASNELFYGARHLGMYSESVPNEVETRFTYGGWGFGHRVPNADAPTESLQASGWAGKEIPADTVFEISLHESLPDPGEKDLVLESERSILVG